MGSRWMALALVVVPALALAQDAKRFNLAELEKQFAPLPVFQQKGGVVDNEVIVTHDGTKDRVQAVYLVRAELAKVVAFYEGKLALKAAKQGDDELGTTRYVLSVRPKKGDKRAFKATVERAEDPGLVQITLVNRALAEDEEVEEPPASDGSHTAPSSGTESP
jgi:hypothetical protein